MNDADVTTLALGTDLTSLGLHLNGMDALYLTFASPWADGPIKPEPVFKVLPGPFNTDAYHQRHTSP